MKKTILVLGLLVALLAFFTFPAFAADKPLPQLTIKNISAQAFSELPVNREAAATGMRVALKHAGKVLVSVDAEIVAEWTEGIKNASIRDKDIKLVLDGGEEVPMTGYFERFADFRVSTNSFYDYRRDDWKEKPRPNFYNAVFAVPQGTTSAEFKLGPATAKVAIPGQVLPPPDPASLVTLKVAGTKFVNEIRNTHSVSGIKPKPATIVRPAHGRLLEIKVQLTPTRSNGTTPSHFFWLTNWLSLVTGDGHFAPMLGEMFMDHLNDYVSHNLNKGSDGGWSTSEVTLYFLVPEGTTAYTLSFLGAPMVKGELQPAQPAEPKVPSKEKKAKDAIKGLMDKVKK